MQLSGQKLLIVAISDLFSSESADFGFRPAFFSIFSAHAWSSVKHLLSATSVKSANNQIHLTRKLMNENNRVYMK